ncbi:MAG: hypothetical protein J5766_05375 [Clostridia bacterium]|nr:hypothetical protein [Clostridia bacterium]
MRSLRRKALVFALSILVFILVLSPCTGAFAMTQFSGHSDVPYDTYTYWQTDGNFKAVYTKPLFEVGEVLSAHTLGLDGFSELVDISVSEDGYVYILDSSSRMIVLTKDHKVYKEIKTIGDKEFKGARGIYVVDDDVYISDTDNMRVLITDKDGNFKGELLKPDSPVVPDDFSYKPIKTAVDKKGYKYILCDGSYYGALLYSPENKFLSFYGSNSVKTGIVQFLEDIWNRLTMTDEKYEKQARKFPYQFTDLCIDKNGFVYTSTGKTESSEWVQKGVIRKLAPNGNDIIDSGNVVFGEKEVPLTFGRGFYIHAQNMGGVTVDDDDYFYTFDTTYNKIYMYDSECNNVCVIGGGFDSGRQKGTFQKINAIDHIGDDLIVIDGIKNTITVFKCNEYGKQLKLLQNMTLKGEYTSAKAGWEEILKSDRNNRFAYLGLAKAAYAEGDYGKALELSKTAYEKKIYSEAYVQLRKEFLYKNIWWIILAALAIVAVFVILSKRKKKRTIKLGERVALMKDSLGHPVISFTKMKEKDLASVKLGVVILVVYFLSVASQTLLGSFMFVSESVSSFNILLLLFRTVGLVILWTVSNWAVSCLMGGIGKMKEIFTVVCYGLIPMIIANFAYIILTHVFVPDEVAFLTTIMTAFTIYSAIMIVIGTIIIHDFSFGKFVATALLTVFAMAIVLFIIVLIVVLVQQFIAFGATVYNEMLFR